MDSSVLQRLALAALAHAIRCTGNDRPPGLLVWRELEHQRLLVFLPILQVKLAIAEFPTDCSNLSPT